MYILLTNNTGVYREPLYTHNSSIIKKDVTAFVCGVPASWFSVVYHSALRVTGRWLRRFRRVNVHDSFLRSFVPSVVMTKRRSSFSPAWRLRRKERYLGVVFSSDSPSSLARFSSPSAPPPIPPSHPGESCCATTIVSFSRREKNCAPLLLPLEPVEYIAGVVRLWKSRSRESKYLCPGYMHISYLSFSLFLTDVSSKSRIRVLEHLARSYGARCDSRIIWRVAMFADKCNCSSI